MQKIAAGIVLYNPEIGRLEENINAVAAQCGKIYLLDNGSSNIGEVISMVEGLDCADDITLIKNEKNEGVARALNELSEAAYADGYEWLLTLDHDSVCPANMIEEYEKYMDDKSIGMLCPVVIDLNGGVT